MLKGSMQQAEMYGPRLTPEVDARYVDIRPRAVLRQWNVREEVT